MTATERKSDFKLTTYTPYLALMGELRGVYYENSEENWPHFITAPHYTGILSSFTRHQWFNPLRAKFFRGHINIYLHFVSFLPIDMTQVVEILPQIKQEPTYST